MFGENFPFSKYELYSSSANRDSSAVIVFFADDKAANVWDYHRFSGFDTTTFLPNDVPTGLQWMSYEMAQWVSEHTDEAGKGPVEVSVGYRLFSIGPSGRIEEKIQLLQTGWAWPL